MKRNYQAIVSAAAAAIMAFSSSMTAMAAPEVIQVNGENAVFDCEYYAANNPDVAAACGTDREALIQHYIAYGMKEGRAAYAPGTDVAALLGTEPQAGTEIVGAPAVGWDWIEVDPRQVVIFSVHQEGNIGTKPSTTLTEADLLYKNLEEAGRAEALAKVMERQAALGTPAGDFITDMWQYESPLTFQKSHLRYNIQYKMATASLAGDYLQNKQLLIQFGEEIAFRAGAIIDKVPQNFLTLQSYYIPGYEWRAICVSAHGGNYANGWWSGASADNSSNWKSIDSPFQNAYQFTITQDGVPYTECKMFTCVDEILAYNWNTSGLSSGVICMLVPKGYTGNAYCHIYAGKEENGASVQDTSRRVTMVLPKKATDESLQRWINVISN